MKKLLSFLTALTMITAMTACKEKGDSSTQTAPDVTVSQTMYKEEHVDFPEDKRLVQGMTYIDGQGVRLIYVDGNNCYKFADYDENMAIKSTTELFTSEENAFVNFDCADDGTMIALVTNVHSDYEIGTPEYFENAEFTHELRKYSPDGSGEEIIPLSEFGNYYTPSNDIVHNFKLIDGKILIALSSGRLIMDLEGNILESTEENELIFYCEDSDGKIIAAGDRGWCRMDKLSLTLPEKLNEYGEYLKLNPNLGISKGYGGFKAFFMLNQGAYGLTENGNLVEVFNYNDSLVSINDYRNLVYSGEGKFAGISNEMESTFLTRLTVRPDDYVMNREDVVMGIIGIIDTETQEMAAMYNKKSDSYKVDLKTYTESDDFTAAVLTDDAPDGISYPRLVSMRNFHNLGAIRNMYDLSEEYGGFKKEDILDNVTKSLEIDGGLYGISQYFSMDFYVGRSDYFPKSKMTWQEFKSIYDSFPEDAYFSSYTGISNAFDVYHFLCAGNIGSFVDYEKGECNFNTPEFIEMLEFTKTVRLLPEMDWRTFSETHTDEEAQLFYEEDRYRMSKGEAMIMPNSAYNLSSFVDLKDYYGLNDGELTIVNSPSENPAYPITMGKLYSVVTNGKCPEGAWDYINYITSEDFLTSYLQTKRKFVTFKGAFEKINEQIRWDSENPIYVDENGITHHTYETDNPITEEEYRMMLDYVENCTMPDGFNDSVYNVLIEEYEAFAAGHITAEECAEIIQNRVSIYLSENS